MDIYAYLLMTGGPFGPRSGLCGCCVQRIFSKINRFGGRTIGTVLHMSVGPIGPGCGMYSNIEDVVYKVYYKVTDLEAKQSWIFAVLLMSVECGPCRARR